MGRRLIYWILLGSAFAACNVDTKNYPPEPSIELIEVITHDDVDSLGSKVQRVDIHFSFIDGDGDLGGDSCNMETLLFRMKNSDWETESDSTVDKCANIPYLGDPGQKKTMKAEVIITKQYPYFSITEPLDTFMFSIRVHDRSGNWSNELLTDTMIYKP